MGTRIAQRHPSELEALATCFMKAVRPMVVGVCRDQDFTINMDQSNFISYLLIAYYLMNNRINN